MKAVSIILAGALLVSLSFCAEDKPESGTDQVQPPVLNSGTETEAERAQEAVEQDTAKTEISVGSKGASVKDAKGRSASVDSTGVRVESKKVKVGVKRDSL